MGSKQEETSFGRRGRGGSATRAGRCCWRCYLCFVGVQHAAAFGVFTTVFIVAVAASSLSLSLPPPPHAACRMPPLPVVTSRCPNGKQIYALSSKNLYGMQVPQLVAASKGNNRNILKKMFRISISIRFRLQRQL